MTFEDASQISIKEYLERRNIPFNKSNFCSSPFSSDSNASFKYYPDTNSFFDWSKGFGGGIVQLVSKLEGISARDALLHLSEGEYTQINSNYKQCRKENDFTVDKYINYNKDEVKQIKAYADSRKIKDGYYPGLFCTKEDDKWVRMPSIMYVHVDMDLKPCGAKFRKIQEDNIKDGHDNVRFSARGILGMYILDNIIPEAFDTELYIVEGESSANSLWQYFREIKKSAVVMSFGSVSSIKKELPDKYSGLNRRLIIDYDGSDELFNERLLLYKDLNAKPIKLILPKGEDINSLHVQNRLNLIKTLIT